MTERRRSKWDEPAPSGLPSLPNSSSTASSKWDQPTAAAVFSHSDSNCLSNEGVASDDTSQRPVAVNSDCGSIPQHGHSLTSHSSKWDQSAVESALLSQPSPPPNKWGPPASVPSLPTAVVGKWDQPLATVSNSNMAGNGVVASKWSQLPAGNSALPGTLSSSSSPPLSSSPSSSLSVTDRGSSVAAEAVARVTSMLAAQKRQLAPEPPAPVLPSVASLVSPRLHQPPSSVTAGERHGTKLCSTEYPINDSPIRMEFFKNSVLVDINRKSGAILAVKGKYIPPEEKEKRLEQGESPLHLLLRAPMQSNVDAAVRLLQGMEARGSSGVVPGFAPPPVGGGGQHYVQDKVFVAVSVKPGGARAFDLKEKLQGAGNSFFEHISKTTGARIHLRGQGSGYMEATSGRESFEALHVYLQHGNKEGLAKAKQLCEDLVKHVKQEYETFKRNNSAFASSKPYQSYNAYSYLLPMPPPELYGQPPLPPPAQPNGQPQQPVPSLQRPQDGEAGSTAALSNSSDDVGAPSKPKEPKKRKFVEKIPVEELHSKPPELQSTKEAALPKGATDEAALGKKEDEGSPIEDSPTPLIKADMPPPSFVPLLRPGTKRPSPSPRDSSASGPSCARSLNTHFMAYEDSDSDSDA